MLYDSYIKRIRLLARIRDVMYRFRILILSVLGAVLALLTVYLITKGGFIGGVTLENDEIEYGTPLSLDASTMFSSVRYEYKSSGSTEWSETVPIKPGSYEVRGASNGSFGRTKYSESVTFNIYPMSIEIAVADKNVAYGDLPEFKASRLAYNDKLSEYDFDFLSRNMDKAVVLADISSVKLSDGDGNDVLECYRIACPETEVGYVPRKLEIITDGAEKLYDGTPLSCDKIYFSEDTPFAYEDSADISVLKPILSITDVGDILNTVDISGLKIFNSEGVDVTRFYDISLKPGRLKVTHRALTVLTGSAFKWFIDGETLSCGEFSLKDGSLANGHKMSVSGSIPVISSEEKKDNKFAVKITDAEGKDVGENYVIKYEYGTLEMLAKIILVITPHPLTQVYNGKPLTYKSNNWWSIDAENMREGDSYDIELKLSGERTNVGVSEGKASLVSAHFYNSDGEEVFYYHLTFETAKIEVTPARLEICSMNIVTDKTDDYKVTISDEFLFIGENSYLPEGFYFRCNKQYNITISKISGGFGINYIIRISNLSEFVRGDIFFAEARIGEIIVYDAKGHDVTENYEIIKIPGKITAQN